MKIDGETIFLFIWIIVTVFIVSTLIKRGKKALEIFPKINGQDIKYRDKSASGYSTKSTKTKFGGANKLLEIVVTDKELWIKGGLLSASILERNDLLHKIPINNIISVDTNRRKIIINFTTTKNEKRQVVLQTKKPNEFLQSIKK